MRVLFLDLDTLRPDHLGCYGYHRDTSPFIDSVAAEGVRFDRYYCPNAPCLPSRASLSTGMYGIINGVVGHGGTAADLRLEGPQGGPNYRGFRSPVSENSLFNIFRKAGLHTASVSTFAERHSAWWFNAGLNEQHNIGKGGMESAEEVMPVVTDWIKRNGARDDWMLHVNFWDPHTPYRAPAGFGDPFKNDPLPAWLNAEALKRHQAHVGPHGANEINMWDDAVSDLYPRHPGKIPDMDGLRRMIDGYDCGIRYMDGRIGEIIGMLKEMGVYEDLCVIITSDHGENFGELSIYGEHATADEATCRIPMIIRWPGRVKTGADASFRTNVDLLPTLADMFGLPKFRRWDGESYFGALTAENKTGTCRGRDSVVLTQCAHVCQRSARFDNYLYVRNYHTGYHLFDDEMLFDLDNDPHEQFNIAADNRDACVKGMSVILGWQDEMMKKSPYQTDPLWTVMREGGPAHSQGQLRDYTERLRKTGRETGAAALEEKFKDEL